MSTERRIFCIIHTDLIAVSKQDLRPNILHLLAAQCANLLYKGIEEGA
ncbi:hypothetical protein BRCON_1088 [Candidatus Sumerlaea chitinivorans]|uniref:Uncharacterized protein n=1 Tax=Sumerlaea chitinivorans TaxID=2250252 RepID=A0A2Z4Y610_SUMC1|nr:hypothetical protein BRCON_1088 [Candidatus Sumerlaea chitinivorans]